MSTSRTVYWTQDGWAGLEVGDRIERAGSNQFSSRRVAAGDDLYFVNLFQGEVRLLGALTVGEVIGRKEAERRFGKDIWDADEFAVAAPNSARPFAFRSVPGDIVSRLRFVSGEKEQGVRRNASGGINEQTLRGVRVLTKESAELLETLLEDEVPVATAQFEEALKRVWPILSEKKRRMLRAHFDASDRKITMRELAQVAGYEGWRAANLQYGAVGHEIARITGFPSEEAHAEGRADWTHAIGRHSGSSEANPHESAWEMYPGLVDAMWNLRSLTGVTVRASQPSAIEEDEFGDASETERDELRKARVGQGRFRDDVVRYWSACAVTGCGQPDLLIASHIVPWKDASNQERLDPFNGLLLTPNLDRLFDRGWISFDDAGGLLRSPVLDEDTACAMGIIVGLRIDRLDARHVAYLKRHRALVFRA